MDEKLISIKEIKEKRGRLEKDIGIYKWWCDKDKIETLLNPLDKKWQEVEKMLESNGYYYCFYVGQTKNKNGFAKRIKGQHLRSTKNSTLRRSLLVLFGSENEIDSFLSSCFVSVEKLATDKIDEKEKEQINYYLRLLNLDDLKDTDKDFEEVRRNIVKTLKSKRQKKEQTKDGENNNNK